MAYPMGGSNEGTLRLDFDGRMNPEFHGSRTTSDAGFLATANSTITPASARWPEIFWLMPATGGLARLPGIPARTKGELRSDEGESYISIRQ